MNIQPCLAKSCTSQCESPASLSSQVMYQSVWISSLLSPRSHYAPVRCVWQCSSGSLMCVAGYDRLGVAVYLWLLNSVFIDAWHVIWEVGLWQTATYAHIHTTYYTSHHKTYYKYIYIHTLVMLIKHVQAHIGLKYSAKLECQVFNMWDLELVEGWVCIWW